VTGEHSGPKRASVLARSPIARVAGRRRGRRFVRGGRSHRRRAPACPGPRSASTPQCRPSTAALPAAGKPPEVALRAIMRKLAA
jgi:hypothetical protein